MNHVPLLLWSLMDSQAPSNLWWSIPNLSLRITSLVGSAQLPLALSHQPWVWLEKDNKYLEQNLVEGMDGRHIIQVCKPPAKKAQDSRILYTGGSVMPGLGPFHQFLAASRSTCSPWTISANHEMSQNQNYFITLSTTPPKTPGLLTFTSSTSSPCQISRSF